MKCLNLLLAGVLLFLFSPLLSASSASDLDGLPVTAITLRDDLGRPLPDEKSMLPLIEVRPGDRFSRQAVRKGISYLYLQGKYRDIRVEAFPDASGIRLEYTLFPVIIVERIVLRGNHSLPN